MANLVTSCQSMVNDVPESLAFGLVDLNTGMFLAVHHNVPYFTQDYLDAVAAAAVEMFRGRMISRVEELISKMRGKATTEHFTEEIFMTTKMTYHFMKIIPGKEVLAVLVTKTTTNQGMGWSSIRNGIKSIEPLLP